MAQFPPSRQSISPPRQLLILLGLVCFGLILSGIVSFFMIQATPGASLDLILNNDPAFAELARWMQIVSSLLLFAFPAFLFNIFTKQGVDYFKINNSRPLSLWILTVLIALATVSATDLGSWLQDQVPLSASLKEQFKQVEEVYNHQMLYMLELDSWTGFVKSLILIALLPAIFEELLFRGCLQQILLAWIRKPFWAILVTAIIFSAVHGSYIGFFPRVFIGLILGYVFFYGKNILLNMLIHFINNGVIVAILFYETLQSGGVQSAMNSQSTSWLQIVSLIALVVLFFIFRKQTHLFDREKNKQEYMETPPQNPTIY